MFPPLPYYILRRPSDAPPSGAPLPPSGDEEPPLGAVVGALAMHHDRAVPHVAGQRPEDPDPDPADPYPGPEGATQPRGAVGLFRHGSGAAAAATTAETRSPQDDDGGSAVHDPPGQDAVEDPAPLRGPCNGAQVLMLAENHWTGDSLPM